MRRLNRFGVVLGIMVIGFMMVLVSHAKTPDRETPAVESVCDPLKDKGVTSGLYGLCIAFCEAQDWERCLDAPDTCGQSAAALLEAYENRRSPADPAMPCIVSASQCPCWDGSATAFPGGSNLAEVWTANAPNDCAGLDFCADLDDVSFAGCNSSSSSVPTGGLFTVASAFFVPLEFCQVVKVVNGSLVAFVALPLDHDTFQICLAEHDAFTAGGTFPSYVNNACGLPTP